MATLKDAHAAEQRKTVQIHAAVVAKLKQDHDEELSQTLDRAAKEKEASESKYVGCTRSIGHGP